MNLVAATAIGAWAAAVALAPTPAIALGLTAPLILIPLCWWLLSGSQRWISGFLGAALLLPPLPIALGNSGPHPALFFAAVGAWAGIVRLREWRMRIDGTGKAMLLFLVLLLMSLAPAALYSGAGIAAASLARVILFGISVYIYLYTLHGPGSLRMVNTAVAVRWLLLIALLASAFACVDFYYQLPAPAGYGAQFVWLDTGVFRRAQGFFYEASTLGNFCAFFLVLIAVVAMQPREQRPASRLNLLITGIALSAALVFSYSRASIVALACAMATLLYLRRSGYRMRRWVFLVPLSLIAGGVVVYWVFPAFAQIYLLRVKASFEFFFEEPNQILSGRLESWRTIGNMLMEHPLYLLFGIGYKTLPYSDLGGGPVVADNMYLSLLVETGLPGLLVFLWMNLQILLTGYRAAMRSSLFGTAIFCYWVGEMVQMLSGDLFTYWRVLPLYFWVLACAAREVAIADERPLR